MVATHTLCPQVTQPTGCQLPGGAGLKIKQAFCLGNGDIILCPTLRLVVKNLPNSKPSTLRANLLYLKVEVVSRAFQPERRLCLPGRQLLNISELPADGSCSGLSLADGVRVFGTYPKCRRSLSIPS